MVKHPSVYIKIIGILLFIAAIFGYASFQMRNIIRGPVITINTPENGSSLETSFIEIQGTAQNVSYINLNGQQIFVDEEGIFSQKLLLSYGYNIITLSAEDKFGRETQEILELVYK